MSEIRATTISNAAGTGPITMMGQYAAKAWVNFNGTGTVAIRESGNVSSITDVGSGDYFVNFATAMTDVNYSAVKTVHLNSNVLVVRGSNNDTTRFNVYATNTSNTAVDSNEVHCAVFR